MAFLIRAWLLLLIVGACQRAPIAIEIDQSRVTVHSVLVAGSDSAFVFVASARATDDWRGTALVPVPDASVRLRHAGETITLTYGRKCADSVTGDFVNPNAISECYAGAIPGSIRSGETYELMVDVTGQSIHGSVDVPTAVQIRSPHAAAEFTASTTEPDTLVAEWTAVAGHAVELRIVPDQRDCYAPFTMADEDFGGRIVLTLGAETKATIFPNGVQCQGPVADVHPARLVISRYDVGFEKYTRSQGDEGVKREEARVGLTGAFGYFGAVANAAVPIVLVQ